MPKRITVNLTDCHADFYKKYLKALAIWQEWEDNHSRKAMYKYKCLADLMESLKAAVTPKKPKGAK